MKRTSKTISAILFGLLIIPTYGAQMCVKTNTYISIFRRNVNGTSAECSNTDTDKIWRVKYDYRDITGFASCNEISSTTDPTTVGTTGATVGTNCWCKMAPVTTYTDGIPTGVVSYWVYLKSYDSADACADLGGCSSSRSGCAASCMNAMKNDAIFRGKVFDTIW